MSSATVTITSQYRHVSRATQSASVPEPTRTINNSTGQILANAANGVALRCCRHRRRSPMLAISGRSVLAASALRQRQLSCPPIHLGSPEDERNWRQHRNVTNDAGGTISALDASGAAINAVTATVSNAGQITASADGRCRHPRQHSECYGQHRLIAGESQRNQFGTGAVTVNNNAGGTIQSTNVNSTRFLP